MAVRHQSLRLGVATRALHSPLGQRRGGFACRDSLPAWRRSRARGPSPPRPPIAHNGRTARYGNLDPLSIAYGSRPRLRPDSPAADQPGCGTLGHSVGGIRTPLALLMPTFALPAAPPSASRLGFSADGDAPLPCAINAPHPRLRCTGLSPGGLSAPRHTSTSELLRTLSRVAASKPTSWLSARRDHLAHLART